MPASNKAVLQTANAAISKGDFEGFLTHCVEDIVWGTVGGSTLRGKEAVRQWMKKEYRKPPEFTVTQLIGDEDFVCALGNIVAKDETGKEASHDYCDVWRFRNGKMAELRAFVIKSAEA